METNSVDCQIFGLVLLTDRLHNEHLPHSFVDFMPFKFAEYFVNPLIS